MIYAKYPGNKSRFSRWPLSSPLTMGKQYYCDFCDKSFADNATNRKNHLKGVNHQRMRKQHYSAFRDAATILLEESIKKPCRRFMTDGHCDYGENCKYSHMTPERKQLLEEQVLIQKSTKKQKIKSPADEPEPNLEEWLSKRTKRLKKISSKSSTPEEDFPKYTLPPALLGLPNLPPSLIPPTLEDFQNLEKTDWG